MGNDAGFVLEDVGVLREGRWILQGVNWSVPAGTCCAILGHNGSGKSTLARILAGHLWPSAGRATLLNQSREHVNLPDVRKHIRLVQAAGPYDVDESLSALEVVLTGLFSTLNLYDPPTDAQMAEAASALDQVGLSHLSNHTYGRLSSGERMRALIARALVGRPDLLLLDEPTNGLDVLAREQVLATIQRLYEIQPNTSGHAPPTMVLITHHVEELPPATSQVLLLAEGKTFAKGSPADVLKSEILSGAYRCPLRVRAVDGRWYVEVSAGAWQGLLKLPE